MIIILQAIFWLLVGVLAFIIGWSIGSIMESYKEEKRRKEEDEKPILIYTEMKNKVICETCKCWLSKEDAQRVHVIAYWDDYFYYCRSHKKPYAKLVIGDDRKDKNLIQYYREVEVTEDGIPVGYKKIKNDKRKD